MALDAGTAALLGALAGAVVTGGLTLINTLASNRFQRGQAAAQREYESNEAENQRKHDAAENAAQREHEAAERRQRHAAELLPQRLELIADWRLSLKAASDAFANRDQSQHFDDQPEHNLVGKPWFESFRAHMTDSAEAQGLRTYDRVYTPYYARAITNELTRIENRWIDEALGSRKPDAESG